MITTWISNRYLQFPLPNDTISTSVYEVSERKAARTSSKQPVQKDNECFCQLTGLNITILSITYFIFSFTLWDQRSEPIWDYERVTGELVDALTVQFKS